MARHGKKFNEAQKKVDSLTAYLPKDALALAKETCVTKFDSTIEVHMRMGLDPRQADQQVRDVVVLPNGLGKTVRVLVFAQGEGAAKALEGGADIVADSDEWIQKIQQGFTDFDVAIATPDMMAKAGRLGRVLGPRGLMPNPKAGTVCPAEDLPRVIKEAKAGRVEFRLDKSANLHVPIGKASFEVEKLYQNFYAFVEAVRKAKPSGAKGTYIKRITVTSTMGPGIKVDLNSAQNMEPLA
ncbi:50S ribosomal protein L1 [Flexilinea flocculi]|jgi:large subunit ribosomal protein L1|uniref:Large ribosomal subunit protein uL1 n=1 Tax=Flexilinea flocculi TaxID=1678840 RepID=A0A0K8P9D2_9CHLR|nr:50S ribosomal protein L1 [Flexilinea flocculi]NMB94933.1 50S ribosomal protein L1 [Flexilinea flocculi]GAP39262.1 ribosomal protein L1 [Flexilinea flocculi]